MGYIKIDWTESNKTKIRFDCLQSGELFGFDGGIFVKTDTGSYYSNSFNFINNSKYTLGPDILVKKLKGLLTNIEEDV